MSLRDTLLYEDAAGIRIAFPPPVRWTSRVGLVPWVGILGFGIIAMVTGLPTGLANTPPHERPAVLGFMVLFLCLWLTIGCLGAYRLLLDAFGRELLTVDAERVTFRRQTPLFTRVWTFPLPDVRDLRAMHAAIPLDVARFMGNSRYAVDLLGLTGGVMAFDHGRRTIRVGGGIDEGEAEYVVARILQRFPSLGATGQGAG